MHRSFTWACQLSAHLSRRTRQHYTVLRSAAASPTYPLSLSSALSLSLPLSLSSLAVSAASTTPSSITNPAPSSSNVFLLRQMPASVPGLPMFTGALSTVLSLVFNQSNSFAAPAAADGSILTWMLQSLAGQPHPSATQGERVLVASYIHTMPKRLLARIQNWQYIDLCELLPSLSAASSSSQALPSAQFPLFPGCKVVRHRRQQISSIADWVQAFMVYMVVLLSEHPSANMITIIKASQQRNGLV